jgi:histidinol-phosphatase (PHP family)
MRYSCLHTHTVFCDGKDEVETYCRGAWERGFHSIGFSAHAPIFKKTGIQSDWHLGEDRLEPYLEAVREAQKRWAPRLPVYLGLEIDYFSGLMGPADPDYRDLGLDFTIGSVHYVFPPQGPAITVDSSPEEFRGDLKSAFNNDGEALMTAYWDALLEMILKGGFDILGHLDLVKKNNRDGRYFSPDSPRYREKSAAIIGPIAASGVVVEANTGGLIRNSTGEIYPGEGLLRSLGERRVPVIITADAHRAEHLGGHYESARETLLRAGYTQTVLFGGRSGGNPIWETDPLG